ncbi:unnamed protein product [Gongylonema pulchrum]|uniref:CUE domain-containing protein n=1 Tax=Gongylonema pulchrum TaxID=637853 RepID=A0A183E758_9BILA|nr:unnamed protein product [Gongylonema pulchrum]
MPGASRTTPPVAVDGAAADILDRFVEQEDLAELIESIERNLPYELFDDCSTNADEILNADPACSVEPASPETQLNAPPEVALHYLNIIFSSWLPLFLKWSQR